MEPEIDILTLCRETIDSALFLTSAENLDLQINKHQCKLLANRLSGVRVTLDEIQEIVSHEATAANAADRRADRGAIKELCRVLKAAEALIKDCCCNDRWLKVALRQGDKRQDFAELLHDVDWCTSVLCSIYFRRTCQETDYVLAQASECEGELSMTDYFTLEAAAKGDRDSLEASLKLLKEDHVCVESCKSLYQTEQCLAAQLLGRLQAQALPINGTDVGTSPLILWANAAELNDGIKLGQGSYGKVYETVWQGEKYAKKKFRGTNTSLFKKEVAALAGLDHPHILRLVCCSESNRDALLMELMATDLHALLHKRSAPLPNLQAVDLMLQIAEGMKYLHSKSIAHRDLKSPNILVRFADLPASLGEDARLYAKIGDFGLSKMKNASSGHYSNQTPNTAGTRRWKAPQVSSVEDEDDDPRSSVHQPLQADVYSFGIVCAEILTGEEPFGHDLFGLESRVRRGERPQLPESCPIRLASLVQKCWDGNPLRRPDFAKICRELRYIKELLMKDDQVLLEKLDTYAFQSKAIQVQGPWGGAGGGPFFDGIGTSITGFELKFDEHPKCIWSIKVQYDLNGTIFLGSHHGDPNYGSKFIKILFSPNEFLKKIEGSYGFQPAYCGPNQVTGITSLTFCTNLSTYGPYGGEGDTKFITKSGRVVGLFGRSGMTFDQLGAFIIQDEM